MEFRQLNASIRNNADSAPTIYMALCMVDSLFKDIRDESGEFIYNCPVGDETLPTRLVWLCRIINQIYAKNSDKLERNRTRLDEMMKQLACTEQALDELADICDRKADAQKKLDSAKQELAIRRKEQQRCQALTDACLQIEREIEDLRQFDPDKAQERLDKLNADAQALTQNQEELVQQYRAQKQTTEALRQKVAALKQQQQEQQREKAAWDAQITALQTDMTALQAETAQLKARDSQLQNELTQAKVQRDDGQQSVAQSKAELDKLNADVHTLDAENAKLTGQINSCNEALNDLHTQLETLQGQLQEKAQAKEADAARMAALQSSLAETSGEVVDLEGQLKTLQAAYDEIVIRCNRDKKQISEQQAQTADYQEKELAPTAQLLQDAEAEYLQMQQEKADKEQSLWELQQKRIGAVTEISLIETDIEKAAEASNAKQAELDAKQQDLEALQTRKKQLDDALQTLIDQADALQAMAFDLERVQIPEAKAVLEAEQERKQKQDAEYAELTQRQEELEKESAQTTIKLAELQTKVNEKNEAYQKLTAGYAAKTAELVSLEKQLAELQNKTDAEQLGIYQQQLEDNINELRKIQQKTDETEAKLQEQRNELLRCQQERDKLEQQINELNRTKQEIDAQIKALTPMTAPKLLQQVAEARQRLAALTEARRQLAAAVKTLEEALGQRVSGEIDLNRLEMDLNALRGSVEKVQQALLNCAEKCKNSLKLEDR